MLSEETVDHLFQCPQNKTAMKGFVNRLDEFLQMIQTEKGIRASMTLGMLKWLESNSDITGNQQHESSTNDKPGFQEIMNARR